MRDRYLTSATGHALARHEDLRTEAERARRLSLAASQRPDRQNVTALLRLAVTGLGARRVTPSLPTTASAAT